jgi:hypothetical protein
MDMVQDNPTADITDIDAPPADCALPFTHDEERFTLEPLRPGSWTLVRVTRHSSTPLYTLHDLGGSWRAYRHDGRVTRLDAGTFRELLALTLR